LEAPLKVGLYMYLWNCHVLLENPETLYNMIKEIMDYITAIYT
jgi:hypothetical protein